MSPRKLGYACAVGSLFLGLSYLVAAEAPARYLLINFSACLLGVCSVLALNRAQLNGRTIQKWAMPVMSLSLLLTAFFGQQAHGATRWIAIGPLLIQPSFVVLPLILVSFAAKPNRVTTAAVLISALAIALQPDRGMAGAMTVALVSLAVLSANRFVFLGLASSIVAFLVTLSRSDNLPAMPHVEHVLYSSFDVHPLIGVAVLCGSALLLLPGVLGVRTAGADRSVCLVFASTWIALILAAALGNYPTPVMGYSGAAVLGYVLSVGLLPDVATRGAIK
ncbi:MAG: FtsW/RodA/SpoVE family cell cycle protein [Pseudomonadota bacterium]